MTRLIKFLIILAFLCAGAYFVLLNGETVTVHWGHLGVSTVPAAVAYIVAFFVGAAAVSAFFGYEYMKKSWATRRLARRVRELEAALGLAHGEARHQAARNAGRISGEQTRHGSRDAIPMSDHGATLNAPSSPTSRS